MVVPLVLLPVLILLFPSPNVVFVFTICNMHVNYDNQHQKQSPENPTFSLIQHHTPTPDPSKLYIESSYAKSVYTMIISAPSLLKNPAFNKIEQHVADKPTTPRPPQTHISKAATSNLYNHDIQYPHITLKSNFQ